MIELLRGKWVDQKLISACMVIYNEEAVLERCLTSLQGVVDEIVIVHDGPCEDQSLEIAERFGARIFVCDHVGEAEVHRVLTLQEATCEWVMWIDADEFLPPETASRIRDLVSETTADAIFMAWPLWDGKRELTTNWPYRGLLFRRSKVMFCAIPHMHFRTLGTTVRIPLSIGHRPKYNNLTYQMFRTKWRRWAQIEAELYVNTPFSEIKKYNWPETDWPRAVRFMRKHPYLFWAFGITFWLKMVFKEKALQHGYWAMKRSFMTSCYHGPVFYYVWQYQLKARRGRQEERNASGL